MGKDFFFFLFHFPKKTSKYVCCLRLPIYVFSVQLVIVEMIKLWVLDLFLLDFLWQFFIVTWKFELFSNLFFIVIVILWFGFKTEIRDSLISARPFPLRFRIAVKIDPVEICFALFAQRLPCFLNHAQYLTFFCPIAFYFQLSILIFGKSFIELSLLLFIHFTNHLLLKIKN